MNEARIGIVGCGSVSSQYLAYLENNEIDVVACFDSDDAKMADIAAKHGVRATASIDDFLSDGTVGTVLNLTPPQMHFQITKAALTARKHVYSEKPLALKVSEGLELLDLAASRNVQIGCAPDTFMAGVFQAASNMISSGAIGRVVGASCSMAGRGPDSWHPNPDAFYGINGGPLRDMGPYYISVLVELLGPIRRVSGAGTIGSPTRSILRHGVPRDIPVCTPTHLCALLEFECGVLASLTTSFEVWRSANAHIEIYGSEGTIRLPDPNVHFGTIELWKPSSPGQRAGEWLRVFESERQSSCGRGMGVLDMVHSITRGVPHRADAGRAIQVVKVIDAIFASIGSGSFMRV